MKTITFNKIVPIDTKIDNEFIKELDLFYDDVLLNIDEIETWQFQKVTQDKLEDVNRLKIIYKVSYLQA